MQRCHGAGLWHGRTDEQRSLVEQLPVQGALRCTERLTVPPLAEGSHAGFLVCDVVLHAYDLLGMPDAVDAAQLGDATGEERAEERSLLL